VEGKRVTRPDESNQASETLEKISNRESYTANHIDIIYTNADCFNNKRSDLDVLLLNLSFKPGLIIITEVNPKKMVKGLQGSEFNLKGYNAFCCNIGKDKCRGIIIYVDVNMRSTEVDIDEIFDECIFVQVRGVNMGVLTIGAIYRSPSSKVVNDNCLMNLINCVNSQSQGKLLLLGDFNMGNIDWNNWSNSNGVNSPDRKLLDCLRKNLMQQHVLFPTRARGGNTPHILDLIISNGDFVSDVLNLSPLGKSDHSVLHCKCYFEVDLHMRASKFNYNKGNYESLRQYVNDELSAVNDDVSAVNDDVSAVNDDLNVGKHIMILGDTVNDKWLNVKSILISATEKFIPKFEGDVWKKKAHWRNPLGKEMRELVRKKHRLWTRYQRTRNKDSEAEYKKIRNQVRKGTRKINQKVQYDVARQCKENPKKFWQYINFKTKSIKSIGNIVVQDANGNPKTIVSDSEKAEVFSEFFMSVYTVEPKLDLVLIQGALSICTSNMAMDEIVFSKKDINLQLSKLNVNKSPGPDCIHPRILKELKHVICGGIKDIFDTSYNQGEVPEDWKMSSVSVIFKKGKKSSVENYRPISLTCIMCKIMESLIRDQIMNYFQENKLFSACQYGFIKGRSAVLQLLKIMDDWTSSLDHGNQIDVIYTDFEKAFDKVPHHRLLEKLKRYGLHGKTVRWIKAFLCFRSQKVKINGAISQARPVLSGIPQGSVLGPLLFIIFINDLPKVCENLTKLFLFADDAKVYNTIHSEIDFIHLKISCQNIFDWAELWCMKLNINKCKVLSVVRNQNIKRDYDYFVNSGGVDYKLEHAVSIKDLGVMVDEKLTFHEHINEKINTAFKMLGIINRNFIDLDSKTFLLLYKSLVRSYLEYANSVWSPFKVGLIKDLESVQKRATKMVKECNSLSYVDRLKYLCLPTLKFRRLRGDMIEVFKITTGYYDACTVPSLPRNLSTKTRGNSKKLLHVLILI